MTDCDVLCLSSEHWKQSRRDGLRESLLDRVKRYRDSVPSLIWLDTSDSSGTTSFEVLPYVDLYAKNQLLKDRSRYTAPFYGMRCYTDFYHRCHGIMDAQETWRTPARSEHLTKLAVSWNLGLGSYVLRNRDLLSHLGRGRLHWPFAAYTWKRTDPSATDRTVDVSFRGRVDYERETVTFQRRETYRRLVDWAKGTNLAVAHLGRLVYREYREEMRRCKLVLSPFGFGEINAGRDFECFADGAVLVKPDMEHLVTWPDYFHRDMTYAAYSWDFSDFEATLVSLLSDRDRRLSIAKAGQARYLETLGLEGEARFAEHLEALLQRAIRHSLC